MTSRQYSATELLALKLPVLPGSKVALLARADKEHWPYQESRGRGGKRRLYTPPAYVMDAMRQAQAGSLINSEPAPPPAPLPAAAQNTAQTLCADARLGVLQVLQSLMQRTGYLGCWRVLDASCFGVPTKRRRVFIVAGLREHPPIELLADASPMAAVPGTPPAQQSGLKPFPTLLAGQAPSQIPIHGAGLIAQADGRDSMAERARASEHHGLRLGLDATNFAEAQAAGNAVVPQVVEWIARKLRGTYA